MSSIRAPVDRFAASAPPPPRKAQRVVRRAALYSESSRPPTRPSIPIWVWRVVTLAVMLAALGYGIFFSPLFEIRRVLVEGTQDQTVIDRLQVFKGKNIWRAATKPLRDALIQDFPEVSDVAIGRGIPDTVKITITQRPVELVWVGKGQLALSDRDGFVSKVLEIEGVQNQEVEALRQLPVTLPQELEGIPVVWDSKGAPLEPKTTHLPPAFVDFVLQASTALSAISDFPLRPRFFLVRETTFQLEAITERGWRILFDSTRPLDIQLQALYLVVKEHAAEVTDYIDVRIDGWAYYQ